VSMIEVGKTVPNFKLSATGNKTVELKSLRGNNVVLYFYPKDNTPGCTNEGCDFKTHHGKFKRRKTIILGISRDTVASHEKFQTKYAFPFDLLSDIDEKVCKQFDIIKEKNMYGRKVVGIERSTFLIDAGGKLQREWRKVKVKGHVEEVLNAARVL
jgi:peroxiredoxin Q/BCP